MDLVTHMLVGATAAQATRPSRCAWSPRERMAIAAAGAAFPDIDFAAFAVDPLRFLADWHQGPTHSIVLLPLWALLIGAAATRLARRRGGLGPATRLAALGLALHVAVDLLTAYGTAVLQPLSARRVALGLVFVVDPLFSAIVLAALVASLVWRPRMAARLGGLALCVLVAGQALLQQRALAFGQAVAQARGWAAGDVTALAQPFSPFNWKLVVADGPRYHEAYVNLAGHRPWVPALPGLRTLHAMAASYAAPAQAVWRPRQRPGARLAALWERPELEPYRRFAMLPAVSRIDADADADVDAETGVFGNPDGGAGRRCVWFTDLRYDLPVLPDTFRFGFCRDDAASPWMLHRQRYLRDDAPQRLGRRSRGPAAHGRRAASPTAPGRLSS
jgi:inner membrane protein